MEGGRDTAWLARRKGQADVESQAGWQRSHLLLPSCSTLVLGHAGREGEAEWIGSCGGREAKVRGLLGEHGAPCRCARAR